MSYLPSLQILKSESERMRQRKHKGSSVTKSSQKTAGGKKTGCESRIPSYVALKLASDGWC